MSTFVLPFLPPTIRQAPSHNFVLAKLLPQQSASWTSHYGLEQAAALVTRPFLALRIFAHDVGCGGSFDPSYYPLLFVISPKKPSGENQKSYFTLGSTPGERTLVVKPPIPSGGRTLYVHTSPRLLQRYRSHEERLEVPKSGAHQLETSSLLAFFDAVKLHNRFPRTEITLPTSVSSGGEDAVESDWDTWSGQTVTGTEHLNIQEGCIYDILEFKDLPVNELPTIYEELRTFWQLAKDYSWFGVTWSLVWAQHAIEFLAKQKNLPTAPLRKQYDDLNNAIFQPDTQILTSIPIPFDGDPVPPPPSPSDEIDYDWDDPCPDFDCAPIIHEQTPAQDIKLLVFEPYGTLLDRETGIREAVSRVFSCKDSQIKTDELLRLYIEFEGLRLNENHSLPSKTALMDMARYLGIDVDESEVDIAVQRIACPSLYDGALLSLVSLRAHGYTLVALPSPYHSVTEISSLLPDSISMDLARKPSWPDYNNLLTYGCSILPGLSKQQVVIVTSLPHRAEPATEAGFPTAVVRHPGRLGSKIRLHTMNPTYALDSLQNLVDQFTISASPRPSPPDDKIDSMFRGRLFGSYEITSDLGMGSFGAVSNAFHIITGYNVAVKVEIPEGKPDEKIVLPYEAAIYKQLSGIQGVSRFYWYGIEGTTRIMIIEKLGANLQQLRRICRGRLSLRTVLLLAEQLLTRIEAVHAREIIVRDIKPENFVMGLEEDCNLVHLIDFGIAKLYRDPTSGKHMPYREGRDGYGTPRYASYRIHFGQEQSRRDDMESVGNVLLYLLHGRLPWQGIYAPSIPAKLLRIGEMKSGKVFQEVLASSPSEFKAYFEHVRGLGFEDKPDYVYLRRLFQERMAKEGWTYEDWKFDWVDPSFLERGTLIPGQYKLETRFAEERELGW